MSEPTKISHKEALLNWLRGETFQRPLNQEEINNQLKQHTKLDVPLHDRNMTIRFNSNFLEVVNPLYRNKGFIEAFYIFFMSLSLFAFLFGLASLSFIYPLIMPENILPDSQWSSYTSTEYLFFDIFFLAFAFIGIIGITHCVDFLLHNTYPYTHSAVRFCHKTQRVYAYAPRVSFFAKLKPFINIPWQDAYFVMHNAGALVPGLPEYRWYLGMYELDKSNPKEPIITNAVVIGAPAEGSDLRDTLLLGQWEFIRRYMEEGPQAVSVPEYMLTIANRRESFLQGWKMLIESHGHELIAKIMFFPFLVPAAFVRYLQMHIAPILKWPKEIEQECVIDPNDPYQYEADKKGRPVQINIR